MMRKIAVVVFALMLMAGCSSSQPGGNATENKTQAKEAPKPQTETGREVFQRLYAAARGWAPDAKPYRLQSEATSEANGHDGKSSTWRGSFASASRRSIKTFVWIGGGDPKNRGITPGSEDTYNPSNSSTQAFETAFLKIDSDKAFEVAQKHKGEELLKKSPDQPVTYTLDWDPRENKLLWHVIYGNSAMDAKLRVAVNASSGAYERTEK